MGVKRIVRTARAIPRVYIDWQWITHEDDCRWNWRRVLYAYLVHGRLRYIGKAETVSVWKRLCAADKDRVLRKLEKLTNGVYVGAEILVGVPHAEVPHRVTCRVLRDLEGLLIRRLQPPDNVMGKRSRIVRVPGLCVRCEGHWPLLHRSFVNR
jgi:hypothetical protein